MQDIINQRVYADKCKLFGREKEVERARFVLSVFRKKEGNVVLKSNISSLQSYNNTVWIRRLYFENRLVILFYIVSIVYIKLPF